jgi:hypothetical protein
MVASSLGCLVETFAGAPTSDAIDGADDDPTTAF